MIQILARVEGLHFTGHRAQADTMREGLWQRSRRPGQRKTVDRFFRQELRVNRTLPWIRALKPITAADLGDWIPADIKPAVISNLEKLQQITLGQRPFRFMDVEVPIRLGQVLKNADCNFLGDALALRNPLRVKNWGQKSLEQLTDILRALVVKVETLPSPKPLSDSSLLVTLEEVSFRMTDGILTPSSAAEILKSRLNEPDAQVEILSPSVLNLSPWVPTDLEEKVVAYWEKLKDIPVRAKSKDRDSIMDIELRPLLTSRLRDIAVETLGDLLALDPRIEYNIGLVVRLERTANELRSVLRQIIEKIERRDYSWLT